MARPEGLSPLGEVLSWESSTLANKRLQRKRRRGSALSRPPRLQRSRRGARAATFQKTSLLLQLELRRTKNQEMLSECLDLSTRLTRGDSSIIPTGTTVLVWTINLPPPPQPENTLSGRMKRRLVATLEAPSRTLPVPQTPVYLVIDPTQLNILLDHRPTLPGQRLQNL